MEEEPFLRRIQTEFPDLQWTSHRYLAHGWDHAVLILDEALVFRAPKAKAYRDALADEARLLRYLQPRVEVGIPDYVYQSADGSFAGYPMLVGRELDAATFGRLSADERGRIADQLAAFLTALHETPKSVARECGVSEQDPRQDHEDLVRDVEALVLPRLAPHEAHVVRAFLTELATELAPACRTALVHGDLSGEHILWYAEKQRVSVIDFSDRSIGDPALDFAGLLAYGQEFAEHVVGRYRGPKEPGRSGGRGCTSAGARWRRWRMPCRAIRAPSRKATRSSGRASSGSGGGGLLAGRLEHPVGHPALEALVVHVQTRHPPLTMLVTTWASTLSA